MDTKQKILDVALTLFAEKGYGNVYVGQIAERAYWEKTAGLIRKGRGDK